MSILARPGAGPGTVSLCEGCPLHQHLVRPFSSGSSSSGEATRVSQHGEVHTLSLPDPPRPDSHGSTCLKRPDHSLPHIQGGSSLSSLGFSCGGGVRDQVDEQQRKGVNKLNLQGPTPGSQVLSKLALPVPAGPQNLNPPPQAHGLWVGAGCPCN